MAWIYLLIAGIMEWGWPMGLKYAWTDKGIHYVPAIFSNHKHSPKRLLFVSCAERNSCRHCIRCLDGNRCCRHFLSGYLVIRRACELA